VKSLVSDSTTDPKSLSAKEIKSAIRVDVLDLPSQKLSELQDVDISQEVDTEDKPKEDNKNKMLLPEESKDPKNAGKKDKNTQKRMQELRDELRNEARRQALIDKLKKEQSQSNKMKRQALAGNKLSEGYSLTGDVAKDGDIHAGKVKSHLYKFWKLPGWMQNSKKLRTQILVKLAPDGRVLSKNVYQSSGNSEYDGYALQAIEAADPFPAPPDSLKKIYLEEGMLCAFPE
jgi:TonB family protein